MKLVMTVYDGLCDYCGPYRGYTMTLDGIEIASYNDHMGTGLGPELYDFADHSYAQFVEAIQRALSMASAPWEYSFVDNRKGMGQEGTEHVD